MCWKLRPVHNKDHNYQDNYIGVHNNVLYITCRLLLYILKFFKVGWILTGSQCFLAFISWTKCSGSNFSDIVSVIVVVVWTYSHRIAMFVNVIVIFFGVSRP